MDAIMFIFLILCYFAGELSEYCTFEVFKANCAPDHVVVMTTATYGRMRLGRCITEDYGYIGCGLSVIGELDRYCSGRRSCEMPPMYEAVSHETLSVNCNKDLQRFLLAEYRCING